MSEYMPEDMSDRMPEDMSEYMPEDMPDRMPEDMSDRMPEDMPDRMPEDLPDRMPEDMPEDMPDHMPEDMPDRMPNRMSEDMSDRMPKDLPVRTCINVMVGITRSKVIFFLKYGRCRTVARSLYYMSISSKTSICTRTKTVRKCRQITTNQTTHQPDDPQIPQPDLRFVKRNNKPDKQKGPEPKQKHIDEKGFTTAIFSAFPWTGQATKDSFVGFLCR